MELRKIMKALGFFGSGPSGTALAGMLSAEFVVGAGPQTVFVLANPFVDGVPIVLFLEGVLLRSDQYYTDGDDGQIILNDPPTVGQHLQVFIQSPILGVAHEEFTTDLVSGNPRTDYVLTYRFTASVPITVSKNGIELRENVGWTRVPSTNTITVTTTAENDWIKITIGVGAPSAYIPIPSLISTFLTHLDNASSSTVIDVYGVTADPDNVPQTLGAAYFGAGGGNFSGSEYSVFTGDYSIAANEDFTIDFWANTTNPNAVNCPLMMQNSSSGWTLMTYLNNTGAGGASLMFAINTWDPIYRAQADVASGEWAHCAVTRSSGDIRAWINGSFIGKKTNSGAVAATRLVIGTDLQYGSPANMLYGKIDEVRFVKGTAVWNSDSDFVPPTAPYAT